MTPRKLIWKELWQRPTAMTTCLLAITLGVAALVAIRSVTVHSEDAVASQLEALGANVLLLPRGVTLQDYYAADLHGATLPEEHAETLALANLEGVQNVSPKLCVPAEWNGQKVTLTGILPQSEFLAKAAWQSAAVFSRKHVGCKRHVATEENLSAGESLTKQRYVRDLGDDEALVGADIAEAAGIKVGDSISLLGREFNVSAVLTPTGSVDDGRVFAHLHMVQRLAETGANVNSIELMACCEDAAGQLIGDLAEMFPDAKVVTISQVVQTQVSINRLMTRLSYLFLGILTVVGIASIAGTMFANVAERRREIGTLMALGAPPGLLARLFLGKAIIVGLAGGLLGYVVGTSIAVVLGPYLAGVSVQPILHLGAAAILVAGAVSLSASYLPARRAALLDPCVCFREV